MPSLMIQGLYVILRTFGNDFLRLAIKDTCKIKHPLFQNPSNVWWASLQNLTEWLPEALCARRIGERHSNPYQNYPMSIFFYKLPCGAGLFGKIRLLGLGAVMLRKRCRYYN